MAVRAVLVAAEGRAPSLGGEGRGPDLSLGGGGERDVSAHSLGSYLQVALRDRAVRPGRAQRAVQPRRRHGGIHGGVLVPVVAPAGGARLRIEIDEDGAPSLGLGNDRQIDRQRGLAHPALLSEERKCIHSYDYTYRHVYRGTNTGFTKGATRVPFLPPAQRDC